MPKSLFRRISKKFFIILNLLTAVCFLIGCYASYFYNTGGWMFGLFPMIAFYLLLVLLLFFLFWLFLKSKWAIVFILAILAGYRPLSKIIPFRLATNFNKEKDTGALRIMSWNVAQFNILNNKQQPETRDRMMNLINEYRPDIACFQEMVAGDTLYNLNTPYYHKYSFFSVFEYESKLGYPGYFFSYNFKEDFLNHQHFGLIIFSKYPIINRRTVTNYPYDYNNNFQYADIVNNSDTIRVFNLHLQSLKFSANNLQYIDSPTLESKEDLLQTKSLLGKFRSGFVKRKLQADRIRGEIDLSPYPVIVCGDFNDVPNSYAYNTIGNGLQNAFAVKGAGLGRTFSGIAPTLRIDNIFAHPAFLVQQYCRVKKKLSDHFPIIADVTPHKIK